MLQNVVDGENKEINFNILTDVNSNNNRYEYSYENYIIKFDIQNNKLTIEIQNKINSQKYQKQYTQDELIEINKVFSMFDNVEECINIIEINKNNFSIVIEDNTCNLTIKLDVQELPKNNISDKIIFKIPLTELKLDKNNSNMSQINRNLKCLKIESNVSMESINNASPHNSIKSNNSNINLENINNIIQNLLSKIDILSKENKEINFNILTDVNSNNNRYEYSYESYIIKFDIQNNKLTIEIQNKINTQKYQKQYTQDELIEINKVFSMFDSVEECINIIEINKNNFSISNEDNICNLIIKLDVEELPKNNISDKIIFKIPLISDLKLEKNSSNMSQINKNLKCLKIESNVSMESINNASPHNSNRSNNSNINLENINNIVQNLVSKIDILSKENKEIKERLNVLEENNNKLIKLIKENRINSLKEKYNSDNTSINLFNNNLSKIEINNKIILDENFDPGALSLLNQSDSQNENQNFLTKVYKNFLKNKTKNKNEIEEGLIHKKIKKDNQEPINIINKEQNLDLFSDKFDTYIYDDIGFFKGNSNQTPLDIKKNNNKSYDFMRNNNIMNIDEKEEKKNLIRKKNNSDYVDNGLWSVNESYNMVGACLHNEEINKNKKKEDDLIEINQKDESQEDEYMF